MLNGAHNPPITTLVRATYFRLAELFATQGREAYAQKATRNVFSKAIMIRLREN